MAKERTYVCIDLKSFYASVECVDRGLDPLAANLVVADPERTEKTICLAITPSMKALGLSSRCRVFEIPAGVDYVMAKPRMQRYMEVSADIYSIYLRYVSPEDVHAYSIDECFIDATPYLALYRMSARQFAVMLMDAVLAETGVCATAGVGSNLFLAKVALDITAKHAEDRIGYLDQAEFERSIQTHRPITDIWNIGPGIAKRLAKYAVYDLRGVCEMSESTLYREFGVNAEYLIDHAHGVEPCTIADIHAYEPGGHSLGNGQVLPCDYSYDEAKDVLKEMVDQLVLDLVDKRLVAASISLYVGYAKDPGERAGEADGAFFDGGHGRRPASGRRGGGAQAWWPPICSLRSRAVAFSFKLVPRRSAFLPKRSFTASTARCSRRSSASASTSANRSMVANSSGSTPPKPTLMRRMGASARVVSSNSSRNRGMSFE